MQEELKEKEVLAMYDVRKIQDYIFRTNRIKEIKGASVLIENIILEGLEKVICQLGLNRAKCRTDWENDDTAAYFKPDSEIQMQVIFIGGGNAFVLFRKGSLCEQINRSLAKYNDMGKELFHELNVGAKAFLHSGEKGETTESNWIEWFRMYLPNRYKVDKGVVIDSTGKQSEQIDLIIYDAQYSYLVFRQKDKLLIPAESVYAVFEVKQTLNKKYIEYAGNKAKSVRKLERTSTQIKHAGGTIKAKEPDELHEILAGILTTRSSWKKPIKDNVVKYVREREREERLDFVCSLLNNTFVIENNRIRGEYNSLVISEISYCEADMSLIYLLLNLLRRLQAIGTVPAIDYTKYAENIPNEIIPSKKIT